MTIGTTDSKGPAPHCRRPSCDLMPCDELRDEKRAEEEVVTLGWGQRAPRPFTGLVVFGG